MLVVDKTPNGTLGTQLQERGINVLQAAGAEELVEMLGSAHRFRAVVVFRMLKWAESAALVSVLPDSARRSLSVFIVGRESQPPELDCAVYTFHEPLDLDAFCKLLTRTLQPPAN